MTGDRATELRDAFDRAFAEAPPGPRPESIDLLRIRVGDEVYAVAMSEIAAVYVDRHVCTVPSASPVLLGLVAVRSAVIPLYDLRAILGVAGQGAPRWCVVARDGATAYAFDAFESLVRVTPAAARVDPHLIDLAAVAARHAKEP